MVEREKKSLKCKIFSPNSGMGANAILGPLAEAKDGKDIISQLLKEESGKG